MQVSASQTNQKGDYRMKDLGHYSILAEMFGYPSELGDPRTGDWRNIVMKYDPELSRYLEPFINHIDNHTIEYRQEYFVSTFDVQPLCCLDIGYVLFGEDYRRGQFMANLRMEHRNAGNDCGKELPDHLPVILNLLPKLADEKFAEEIVWSLLIPAVEEMIAGFRSDDNHYKGLLRIILAVMNRDFPASEFERFPVRKREKVKEHL
jgi:nitrate reductase molybdenum cofactor assembly chaperone